MQTLRLGHTKLALFSLSFICLSTSSFSLQTHLDEVSNTTTENVIQISQSQHNETERKTSAQKVEEQHRKNLIASILTGGLVGGIGGFLISTYRKRKRVGPDSSG